MGFTIVVSCVFLTALEAWAFVGRRLPGAYPAGVDVHDAKFGIKKVVEHMKGKLPAEHGHGTEYTAPPDAQARLPPPTPTDVSHMKNCQG